MCYALLLCGRIPISAIYPRAYRKLVYASSEMSVQHRPPKWRQTMDTPTKYGEYTMSAILARPLLTITYTLGMGDIEISLHRLLPD